MRKKKRFNRKEECRQQRLLAIIIDRDEEMPSNSRDFGGHSREDFDAAFYEANKKNIHVIWSNPCFEIWFLLHFNLHTTAIDRKLVLKKVEEQFIKSAIITEKIKANKGIFNLLGEEKLQTALNNAEKLLKIQEGKTPAICNPGTTVHQIINELITMNRY